jgi:hypothetical protein
MKHFLILLTVALITLTILFALHRPDILEDVWLWLIGLIGPIIALAKRILNSIVAFVKKLEKEES